MDFAKQLFFTLYGSLILVGSISLCQPTTLQQKINEAKAREKQEQEAQGQQLGMQYPEDQPLAMNTLQEQEEQELLKYSQGEE